MSKDKPDVPEQLQDMIDAKYSHADVRAAVAASVIKHGTAQDIIDGKLHLPSVYDAERHTAGVDTHEQAMHWKNAGRMGGPAHNPDEHREAMNMLRRIQEES